MIHDLPTGPGHRWRRQPLAVGSAILAIVLTIAAAAALRPVGLAEVMLLVLVEVLVVSLFAGRAVAGATAVMAVLAVNWFLVAPYDTFAIQEQQNWVTLGVFLLLSLGASSLVESVLISERAAAAAATREAVLAEALRPDSASAADSLRAFRSALDLDEARLVGPGSSGLLISSAREQVPSSPAGTAIEVTVAPGFTVVGRGAEILGVNREFANTLATAVVRAWESQELVAQQEHAAQLAEIDRARATLLASVGHDLRTPLAGIRLTADALALSEGALADADRADLLDGLRQSAVRLDELLGAVLDSSRIEAGVLRVDELPTDLPEVAARATAAFTSPRVHVLAPAHPVNAMTDPALLERIVANLLANALAHTPEDASVEVTFTAAPGSATVSVVDHGPGMDTESADVGRSVHGLGLLIVDRLAGFLGAKVTHHETDGGGLTVSVRLKA